MDANLTNVLIALAGLVGGYLTFKTANQKTMHEREQFASKEWQSLYDEIKQRMDESEKESSESIKALRAEIQKLKEDMSELRANHAQEVKALNEQNIQLKEENRQLRTENANYRNRLIELGDNFNGV